MFKSTSAAVALNESLLPVADPQDQPRDWNACWPVGY